MFKRSTLAALCATLAVCGFTLTAESAQLVPAGLEKAGSGDVIQVRDRISGIGISPGSVGSGSNRGSSLGNRPSFGNGSHTNFDRGNSNWRSSDEGRNWNGNRHHYRNHFYPFIGFGFYNRPYYSSYRYDDDECYYSRRYHRRVCPRYID